MRKNVKMELALVPSMEHVVTKYFIKFLGIFIVISLTDSFLHIKMCNNCVLLSCKVS